MGIWSGNSSFGNILGTFIVVCCFAIFGDDLGWSMSLLVVALFVALEAMFVYKYLNADPHHTEESSSDDAVVELLKVENTSQDPSGADLANEKPISFWKAWLIPGVLPYAMSYACLKSVNYALFFWLPFYLNNAFEMSNGEADAFSVS